MTDLSEEQLLETVGRMVLVDPNRRDLLMCMHELSTVQNPRTYCWTKNNECNITKERKLRKIGEDMKPVEILEAEALLSELNKSTLSPDRYTDYLVNYTELAPILMHHYGNTMTASARPVPYHRKARFTSVINKNKADDRLALELGNSFGRDAVLLAGDWSAPNQKYHQPIRGKGIRDALRLRGFQVFLLDEFRTSKVCPRCMEPSLKKFKRVINPRLWQRDEYPMVSCNGLLRCTSQECMQIMRGTHRCWNRGHRFCIEFRHILNALRRNGMRPQVFQRPARSDTNNN